MKEYRIKREYKRLAKNAKLTPQYFIEVLKERNFILFKSSKWIRQWKTVGIMYPSRVDISFWKLSEARRFLENIRKETPEDKIVE